MRVLFLASDINQIGGIQQYNRQFLKTLRRLNQNILLIERRAGAFLPKAKFVFNFFWGAVSFRPDIIICGHINFSPIVYFLSLFFNHKYIIITHGLEVWDIKSRVQLKALERAFLIVSVSNHTKGKILNQLPHLKGKIFLLPNSVDDKKFFIKEKPAYLLQRHALHKDEKMILTVARLSAAEKMKGYDKIIEAIPLIMREIPTIKYFLVGDGDDRVRIRRLIEKLGLDDRVTMVGHVGDDEIVSYYNLCDVFVMPSKSEGFGISFLEALACGKPVIGGNRDASIEPLLNGELGLLVNPDSVIEIAEATVRILKKKIQAHLLDAEFLRRRVLEEYGLDKFKRNIVELIKILKQ